jgi:four helix bundle protein
MSLSHHSLVAWQRADDLFIKLHRLSSNAFPASERYDLSSQLRRTAYSVAANIVEGFARRHRRDRLHFLNIAESSLAEVGYCIHVARRLGYISEALEGELEMDVRAVGAPLAGLIRHTRSALTNYPQTWAIARQRIAVVDPAEAPSVRADDSASSNSTLG